MEDVKKYKQRTDELDALLSSLRNRKEELRVQAEGAAQKRNELNDRANELRIDIRRLRDERDSINLQVQQLKLRRADMEKRIRDRIEEARQLKEAIRVQKKGRSSRNLKVLQKEFENIEWKIQTSSLSLQEEKELVEKSRGLEIQIKAHEKIQRLHRENEELKSAIECLRNQSETTHQQLIEEAERSQQIHEKMKEAVIKLDSVKMQADDLHKSFIKIKEETKPVQEQIVRVTDEIGQRREQALAEEKRKKKEDEEETRTRIEKQAREKARRGEKLSWEEFQLLAEGGMESQA